MRSLKFLFLILFIFTSCASIINPSDVDYWIDENGKSIKKNKFLQKWRSDKNVFARWDYIKKDSGRIAKLSIPLYEMYSIPYSNLLNKMEESTGKHFNTKTIFIIQYKYLNDFCTVAPPNNTWDRNRILERKQFLDQNKELIEKEYPKSVYLHFFEEGIALSNNPKSENEYFYKDVNNVLKNSIFKHPTLCGYLAIIKPNGNILVRNGEYSAYIMTQHLKPKNWNLFF